MKKMIGATVASLLLLTLSLGLAPRPAAACSYLRLPYSEPKTYQEMVAQADAVFAGKVIGVNKGKYRLGNDAQGNPLLDDQGQIILFEVHTVWKGPSQSQIIVRGIYSMCNRPLRVGANYIMYAAGPADDLALKDYTLIQSRYQDIKSDFLALRRGVPPAKQVSLTLPGEPLTDPSAYIDQPAAPIAPVQQPLLGFQYIVAAVTGLGMLGMSGSLVYFKKKAQTS